MIPEDYLAKAVFAALDAGAAALDVYSGDFEVEEKSDHTPLTLADQRSHEIIASRLKSIGIPVLSEEGRDIAYDERKGWQHLWIVDPLDGTKEFVQRNGEFTINIALVENGLPVLGVVFVPVKDDLYFAVQNKGSFFVKGEKIFALGKNVSAGQLVAEAQPIPLSGLPARPFTIMGSRSHASSELSAFVEKQKLDHPDLNFISAGSSLKFCLVAAGLADMYPRTGPTMEWDTAAGQAVVEMAGGAVVEFESGRPLGYNKESLLNPWFIVYREKK